MPRCIYCTLDKPLDAFDPEHVFSRGLCGPGQNWTLGKEVCRKCNGRFSAFEAHWMRQAIEATARNFHGLQTRNDTTRFDRPQPVEIDDLYCVNKGDWIVYEAGFTFPADHHYRPQLIQTPTGLLCIAASIDDGEKLQAALNKVNWQSVEVTIPFWQKRHTDFLIAEFEPRPRQGYVLTSYKREQRARGLWLRDFPHDSLLKRDRFIDTEHTITTRMALDHRGRLYLRAANIETVPAFLNLWGLQRFSTEVPPQPTGRGEQTMVFGLHLDLVKIYQAVMKNGLNLFTHFYGAAAALDPTLDPLRRMLMDEPTNRKRVMQHCRVYDANPPDFPKSGNPLEHRMQLEMNTGGALYFRMRLFDALGYEAFLGMVPASLRNGFQTRRAVVDFTGAGICEVARWP
ncbi:hypothetical protein P7D22_11605 [Lichenihabitans sp. Uapishka_5]|uniref:hypothetical protein n=1 Tax=Lichenihabitans sp. Uapishka_5 TaxID=3037302 RepID=UPI0029E80139|nr:hypothetical protein [Lichenihabitans sp. Uapishka_5]MDX7951815.1 hypothetical protein [Lichenihabitans sp. Uapishka_5]